MADVTVGGNIRRGLVDLDGRGKWSAASSSCARENALNVIKRVKAKLAEVQSSLPKGVKVVPVYDRSHLIMDSVATLTSNLLANYRRRCPGHRRLCSTSDQRWSRRLRCPSRRRPRSSLSTTWTSASTSCRSLV